MLLWKIFAAIDVLINLGYWRAILRGDEQLDLVDGLTIPVGLGGTAALITYAFALPTLADVFWQFFLPLFLMIAAWEIASAAGKEKLDPGRLIGVVLAMLLAGIEAVAIYRLGDWAKLVK